MFEPNEATMRRNRAIALLIDEMPPDVTRLVCHLDALGLATFVTGSCIDVALHGDESFEWSDWKVYVADGVSVVCDKLATSPAWKVASRHGTRLIVREVATGFVSPVEASDMLGVRNRDLDDPLMILRAWLWRSRGTVESVAFCPVCVDGKIGGGNLYDPFDWFAPDDRDADVTPHE